MTTVIAIQGLVTALAGLLLLEARTRREERQDCTTDDATRAPDVDFHPELIIAWDDEASDAPQRTCIRPVTADQRVPRRPQLAGSHTRLRQR